MGRSGWPPRARGSLSPTLMGAVAAATTRKPAVDDIGMDVHKQETQVCIEDADGRVVLEQRIRTTRERLTVLGGGRPRARILLEAATESEWVAQHRETRGHEVIVAAPNYAAMYATRSRRVKPDRRDAPTLADACRLGAYHPAHRTSAAQHAGAAPRHGTGMPRLNLPTEGRRGGTCAGQRAGRAEGQFTSSKRSCATRTPPTAVSCTDLVVNSGQLPCWKRRTSSATPGDHGAPTENSSGISQPWRFFVDRDPLSRIIEVSREPLNRNGCRGHRSRRNLTRGLRSAETENGGGLDRTDRPGSTEIARAVAGVVRPAPLIFIFCHTSQLSSVARRQPGGIRG